MVDPVFKLTFLAVIGVASVLFVALVCAAIFFHDPMTDSQRTLEIISSHGLFMCIGLIIGGAESSRLTNR